MQHTLTTESIHAMADKKDMATIQKVMTKLEKESKEANSKMIESLQETANLKGQVEALEKVLNQSKSKK